jgi:hypothetical protein
MVEAVLMVRLGAVEHAGSLESGGARRVHLAARGGYAVHRRVLIGRRRSKYVLPGVCSSTSTQSSFTRGECAPWLVF